MFDDGEGVERLEEILLKPATIDLSITVQPVIYSIYEPYPIFGSKPTTVWRCLFEIRSKKDTAFYFSTQAFGSHGGERQGPHWEQTVNRWQKQYDFIQQYIGSAVLSLCTVLVQESHHATFYDKPDWKAATKEVWKDLGTLTSRYHKEEEQAREEQDWNKVRHLVMLREARGVAMKHVALCFGRLRKGDYLRVGQTKSPLRFTLDQLEALSCCYKDYQRLWNTIASIADSKRVTGSFVEPYTDEEWENIKAEIKQICQLPGNKRPRLGSIPDHLLDELRLRKRERAYEPYQLALVHAAIECGVFLAGRIWPKARNWRVISDELQEYRRSIGAPVDEATK